MSLYFNAGVFEGSPPSGGANGLHPYLIYDLTVAEPKRLTGPVQSLVFERHHLPCDLNQPLP